MWKLKTGMFFITLAFLAGVFWLFSFMIVPADGVAGGLANAVGVSIGVEENVYNRVAKQLEERAKELDERETSLVDLEKEIVTEIREERKKENIHLLYIAVFLGIISILLFINFYFDWKRSLSFRKNKK